jgi:predicted nucleic acid-binding protein
VVSHQGVDRMVLPAIARVNGYTVATRNIKDFTFFDVPLVNPFEYRG